MDLVKRTDQVEKSVENEEKLFVCLRKASVWGTCFALCFCLCCVLWRFIGRDTSELIVWGCLHSIPLVFWGGLISCSPPQMPERDQSSAAEPSWKESRAGRGMQLVLRLGWIFCFGICWDGFGDDFVNGVGDVLQNTRSEPSFDLLRQILKF